MKVLVGCEFSGRVRDAFIRRGHHAVSLDFLPSDTPGPHIIAEHDLHILDVAEQGWDLFIVHPDCTYLCSSGLHWNTRRPERQQHTEHALAFVRALLNAPVARIALENPIGCISSRIRKPNQIIQPYHFGDDASKATCLWLKGLPPLRATKHVEPRIINGKPRWANQTDSGQNKLAPSTTRSMERARTYQGIADAMAAQWGAA